jgi:AAA domain
MRKQKASDRRTRRRQQDGDEGVNGFSFSSTLSTTATRTVTSSPMDSATWTRKKILSNRNAFPKLTSPVDNLSSMSTTGGRGRSRKRSTFYLSLAYYHQYFLRYLTAEYQAEEEEVLSRIKTSLDNGSPIGLEISGHALFDMYLERRGNLFQDEVYRLTKATDATTIYNQQQKNDDNDSINNIKRYLPSNHKFSNNDVILLTIQPSGSGDFFFIPPAILSASSTTDYAQDSSAPPESKAMSPSSSMASSIEARVLSVGPSYVDIVLPSGKFEMTFGVPASNDWSGTGKKSMRFRVDRFFSEVPYQRMVSALSQITSIAPSSPSTTTTTTTNNNMLKNPSKLPSTPKNENKSEKKESSVMGMDNIFREAIVSTFAFTNAESPLYGDTSICNIDELSRKIAKPPMGPLSQKLATQVIQYMSQNPRDTFRPFNEPQRIAIGAALTRRLTMIQGPPGTGKTACAAAIGFGFVHQCRALASSSSATTTTKKVLACAFSNVGADNLAEALLQLGLNVVRIGKPSAVSESLWNYTLEAAIDRDPQAQKAIQNVARMTALQSKQRVGPESSRSGPKSFSRGERIYGDPITMAVKASIEASNIAATKALREADVIVTTLTGASDSRLVASCGIPITNTEDEMGGKKKFEQTSARNANMFTLSSGMTVTTPDSLPPLTLPFVIVDEACQSVEPANLIPIVSTNSCRSLVILGDPCQLPPTVRSQGAAPFLSQSLMERLAATLYLSDVVQHKQQQEGNEQLHKMDESYINSLPIKQAISLVKSRSRDLRSDDSSPSIERSYKKTYSGSLLLSIQYRMHPSIAALPSAIFYNSLLSTPQFISKSRFFPNELRQSMKCEDPFNCVRVIDVGGKNNERQGLIPGTLSTETKYYAATEEEKTTYWNEAEANVVLSLIKQAIEQNSNEVTNSRSIGVISPYNGQVQLIKSMISANTEIRDILSRLNNVSIEVKSVDGYQGRERDIIIFSSVRSNRHHRIGFLHDWRRMNVALTRAKSALFVVGDLDTLSHADKHWDAFVKWAIGSGCRMENANKK